MKNIIVGLVKGRHEMPVEEYIFESIENVLDLDDINNKANDFILEKVGTAISYFGVGINQAYGQDVPCFKGENHLIVYVTGLTAATAAVIASCARYGVSLTLMHFDASINDYKAQEIFY